MFLAAEAASGGILGALGIDFMTLLINIAAFLVLAGLLGKFVYPVLTKALDAKQGELEAAARHEAAAKEELVKAKAAAGEIVAKARASADEVLSTARTEANQVQQEATGKAAAQAERILTEAHAQVERDVRHAREALKADTARLVAMATETVIGQKLTTPADNELVTKALEKHA